MRMIQMTETNDANRFVCAKRMHLIRGIRMSFADQHRVGMLNEFREDLVSGEWVLFATGRSHSFRTFDEDIRQNKDECPFEDLIGSDQKVLWSYPNNKNVFATVIKNRFPAVQQNMFYGGCFGSYQEFTFDDRTYLLNTILQNKNYLG